MTASTIVEVFVEEEQLTAKIEVGANDLLAFRNVLPDELYDKLTNEQQPLAERFRTFIEQDWVILAGDKRLNAKLKRVAPAKRLVRDEITGEPLLAQPDDAEVIIQVELVYPLQEPPESLRLRPALDPPDQIAAANIGFVVYHDDIAVNDFRYLARAETLHLDWSDPWYSRFENKNLWRRYAAPAAAFLYIENFEVRKEIIFRAKDLQAWIDLGLDGAATIIKADERASITERAAVFLHEHSPLKIDGQAATGVLDRIHFISRTLRTSGVVDPSQNIDINAALLGAIYVYPIDSLPQQVAMDWDLFNDRITRVPTVASDEAGGLSSYLEPNDATLVWQNYLTKPTLPGFIDTPTPRQPRRLSIPVLSLLCLVVVAVVWMRRILSATAKQTPPRIVIVSSTMLITAAILAARWRPIDVELSTAKPPPISNEDAGAVTQSLLNNIYHSFDYRDESRIYDVLNRSVTGDLLTKIYLETQQSLTLASQGGARVKVNDVELLDCQMQPASHADSFTAECTWNVVGSVGHWGHIHTRTNQYRAEFVVGVFDDQWKITEMTVLSEERL
jgi:hypothetical protein